MRQLMPTPPRGVARIAAAAHSYAETMSLDPEEAHGGDDHQLPHVDRWIHVLSGTGRAVVNGEAVELRPGVVVLVEPGERHELRNTGDAPLETLNIYAR